MTPSPIPSPSPNTNPDSNPDPTQELFGRFCSHGKDRAPTPVGHYAARGFGPARRGTAVPMLQEDVARFKSRLRKVTGLPPPLAYVPWLSPPSWRASSRASAR